MRNLQRELERRRRENLAVSGGWTFPARGELKSRGFLWDGVNWLAPGPEEKARALKELTGTRRSIEEWSVTIHGDAGFKEGYGRWAWFCRSSLPPFKVEGVSEGSCKNVQIAEARALLVGVREALRTWPPKGTPDSVLFVRSDNLGVIEDISARRSRVQEIGELLSIVPANVRIDARHVKGHNVDKSTATWVNRRVDAMSNLRGVTPGKG